METKGVTGNLKTEIKTGMKQDQELKEKFPIFMIQTKKRKNLQITEGEAMKEQKKKITKSKSPFLKIYRKKMVATLTFKLKYLFPLFSGKANSQNHKKQKWTENNVFGRRLNGN